MGSHRRKVTLLEYLKTSVLSDLDYRNQSPFRMAGLLENRLTDHRESLNQRSPREFERQRQTRL